MAARHGGFLDDIWTFDNAFFKVTPREAMSMDPQQRVLLQTTQAALDDAGYVPDSTPTFQRTSIGCFVGAATEDYKDNLRDDIDVFYSTGMFDYSYRVEDGLTRNRDLACLLKRQDLICACLEWPVSCHRYCMLLGARSNTPSVSVLERWRLHNRHRRWS